jgi:hypothetical protein
MHLKINYLAKKNKFFRRLWPVMVFSTGISPLRRKGAPRVAAARWLVTGAELSAAANRAGGF